MTCIVGIIDKKNKSIIMGSDSAGVSGLDIRIRKDQKIFSKNDFVFGCTSSFRMIQLLRYSLDIPEIKEDVDIYKYMCTDFIDAVRKCFKDGGYLQRYEDGDEKGGSFLVAYKNRLFSVLGDFQVAEQLNGVDSVGCGSSYALGAIHALIDTECSSLNKVEKALSAAEFYSVGVSRPFHSITKSF